jgi:hypothetical protein
MRPIGRGATRLLHGGFALVVAGIVLATVGGSSRAWSALMLAGLVVLLGAAAARAAARRPRR